jgi:potassium-transporting ATPase KdpC subunit
MLKLLRATIVCFLSFTILVGVFYPLLVWGIAQLAFPDKANGSLIVEDGNARGSRLLGQEFSGPKYFWGRVSATSLSAGTALPSGGTVPDGMSVAIPYAYMYSGGSNLAPTNPALIDEVKGRIDAIHAAGTGAISHGSTGEMGPVSFSPAVPFSGIPVDLVTSSASGLDPDISPAAAQYQAARVAQARAVQWGTTVEAARQRIDKLIAEHTQGRELGVLGEPRINVLELNLALDRERPQR